MEKTSGPSGGSSDFVKKLYKMLEDPTYRHIVRWSDTGDSFVVLDNTEFTKNVLPRHFKHSNFASFVRQLNKYDFHKLRNTEEAGGSQYGEQAWEFKHPNFQMHNKDQLENIKRKTPATRKLAQQSIPTLEDASVLQASISQIETLQNQLKFLKDSQQKMDEQLERNNNMCQALVAQVTDMHRQLVEYEDLIQSLIVRLSEKELELRNVHMIRGRYTEVEVATGNRHKRQRTEDYDGKYENQSSLYGEDDTDGGDYDDEDDDEEAYDTNEDGYVDDMDDAPPSPRTSTKSPTYDNHSADDMLDHASVERSEENSNIAKGPISRRDKRIHSTTWTAGPFDPGGFSDISKPFSNLLSKAASQEGKVWRKLPDLRPSIKTQLNNAGSPFDQTGASSSTAPTPENPRDGELLEVMDINRYCKPGDDACLLQFGATLPPRLSAIKERDYSVNDGSPSMPVDEFQLRPMQISEATNESLPSLSHIKQSLGIKDAELVDNELSKGKQGQAGPNYTETMKGAPKTILIVDDDPLCRRILLRFFKSMGLDVDSAGDGMTAIEKWKRQRYAMIYMDVIMPNLDGVSTTRLIRESDKTTPIICLATNTKDSDIALYKRSGMTGILAKPFGKKKIFTSAMEYMPNIPGWTLPQKFRIKYLGEKPQSEAGDSGEINKKCDRQASDYVQAGSADEDTLSIIPMETNGSDSNSIGNEHNHLCTTHKDTIATPLENNEENVENNEEWLRSARYAQIERNEEGSAGESEAMELEEASYRIDADFARVDLNISPPMVPHSTPQMLQEPDKTQLRAKSTQFQLKANAPRETIESESRLENSYFPKPTIQPPANFRNNSFATTPPDSIYITESGYNKLESGDGIQPAHYQKQTAERFAQEQVAQTYISPAQSAEGSELPSIVHSNMLSYDDFQVE